jgi:dTDP-4-dehydrorhamnose reductase
MENHSDRLEVWGGIECTINRVGNQYFDQLEHAGHYDRDEDIERFAKLGIKTLRYPVLWEKHQPKKGAPNDWSLTEKKLSQLRSYNIEVIAGLVHHGSGPAYVHMLEESFAEGLAAYAGGVAEKFPWINNYTPVNEPLTTARFCGLYGVWYPHGKTDKTFCRILINECKATVLAMKAIRKVNPHAKLVQTEDLGKTHSTHLLSYQAEFENNRRWLSYDLLCGKVNNLHPLWEYLIKEGITQADLDFFIENKCPPDVIGINHYLTSERYLDQSLKAYPKHTHGGNGKHKYADVEAVRVGHICPDGPYALLRETWERYHLPIVVTETHLHCTREEQMRWMHLLWNSASKLKSEGVNIKAITAWALLGSFGWNKLLTRQPGEYEAGVFDLSSKAPRASALATMIKAYNSQGNFEHPVLENAGWWQRKCRVAYGTEAIFTESPKVTTQPILIVANNNDTLTAYLSAICEERGISYEIVNTNGDVIAPVQIKNIIHNKYPWAVIFLTDTEPTEYNYITELIHLAKFCHKHNVKLLTYPGPFAFADQLVMKSNPSALIVKALDKPVNHIESIELRNILQASLNLLMDDEKGIWQISGKGQVSLVKPAILTNQKSMYYQAKSA